MRKNKKWLALEEKRDALQGELANIEKEIYNNEIEYFEKKLHKSIGKWFQYRWGNNLFEVCYVIGIKDVGGYLCVEAIDVRIDDPPSRAFHLSISQTEIGVFCDVINQKYKHYEPSKELLEVVESINKLPFFEKKDKKDN